MDDLIRRVKATSMSADPPGVKAEILAALERAERVESAARTLFKAQLGYGIRQPLEVTEALDALFQAVEGRNGR